MDLLDTYPSSSNHTLHRVLTVCTPLEFTLNRWTRNNEAFRSFLIFRPIFGRLVSLFLKNMQFNSLKKKPDIFAISNNFCHPPTFDTSD